VVVSVLSPGKQEKRLLALAAWMGVTGESLTVSDDAELIERVSAGGSGDKICLALSADTLVVLGRSERFRNFLQAACEELLLFGVAATEAHEQALEWLSQEAASPRPTPEGETRSFSVPERSRTFSRQLAGSSFETSGGTRFPGLQLSPAGGAEAIMLQDDVPVFAYLRGTPCPVFVLADAVMPDVREDVSDQGLGDLYERIIPPLVFLRRSFGNACWHGVERTARVIIDDPLLRRRYGFIDFERLISSIRKTGCGVTIAFIPWNYRRTATRMVSMFAGDSVNLNICIHGCDHTGNEFGVRDRHTLSQKAGLAMSRMEAHEFRTRIPFERVMVFPQGRFSEEAVAALRANGYLAAVDSSCHPAAGGATRLTVGDFLRPAIQFGGFPVFKRHYPRRIIDFAFDLFLGKPAFVVEHHEYFTDGERGLEHLVVQLRNLEPGLTWPTLTSQVTKSCFVRSSADGEMDVEFYTREFQLRNASGRPVRYSLSKSEPDPAMIQHVLVNDVSVPFTATDGRVRVEVSANPGRTIAIKIEDRRHAAPTAFRASPRYQMSVGLRRLLSELRDEGTARHPTVMKAATRLAKTLGVRTGG
jgi:hypothetical protein